MEASGIISGMNRIARNLLSGAAGILVLVPAQPVAFVVPVNGDKTDAEKLHGDAIRIAGYFNSAVANVEAEESAKLAGQKA